MKLVILGAPQGKETLVVKHHVIAARCSELQEAEGAGLLRSGPYTL